jgi:hypothetical protein
MKAYGGMDVQIHIFLTSTLAGGEWSAWRPGWRPIILETQTGNKLLRSSLSQDRWNSLAFINVETETCEEFSLKDIVHEFAIWSLVK